MTRAERLSRAQARRVALAGQGFTDPVLRRVRAGEAVPTLRTLQRVLDRTGVLQVDSVNVLVRAHHVPLWSRMGAHDLGLLRRAADDATPRTRRMVEYWAHVQAYMPVDLWPVMAHRMAEHRARRGKWSTVDVPASAEAELVARIRDRGPSTARDLDAGLPRAGEHWGWNWSATRRLLDLLFTTGDLAIAGRNAQFEIRYDVPERVLPAHVLDAPVPSADEAARELVRRAARSHGVATTADLRDYYRMPAAAAAGAVAELVEAGELLPVQVEGWRRPAYLHHEARVPRRVDARSLLSPFDPVVWERARTEALFDFRYRIEIYTPAERRVHGYYVLPFLLGDRVVARVDLKADRPTGRLLVPGAYAEPDAPAHTAHALAAELRALAGWLGLGEVVVAGRGDLAPGLAAELAASG